MQIHDNLESKAIERIIGIDISSGKYVLAESLVAHASINLNYTASQNTYKCLSLAVWKFTGIIK